jgi:hypothetical protein
MAIILFSVLDFTIEFFPLKIVLGKYGRRIKEISYSWRIMICEGE